MRTVAFQGGPLLSWVCQSLGQSGGLGGKNTERHIHAQLGQETQGVDGRLEQMPFSVPLFPEKQLLGTAEHTEALSPWGWGQEASFLHKVGGSPALRRGRGRGVAQLASRLCPGWPGLAT